MGVYIYCLLLKGSRKKCLPVSWCSNFKIRTVDWSLQGKIKKEKKNKIVNYNCPIFFFSYHSSCRKDQSTTSAQIRECSNIWSDTFRPQLAVQQEASGITRQNVAGPSAGPSSNLNPQSLLQNQFISLAQPYQNYTQHIQIATKHLHGKYQEPSPSTRKLRRIIESDDRLKAITFLMKLVKTVWVHCLWTRSLLHFKYDLSFY